MSFKTTPFEYALSLGDDGDEKKQNHSKFMDQYVMNSGKFTLEQRSRYDMNISGNTIFNKPMSGDTIVNKLEIPKELINLLDKELIVIAGGSMTYIGCPTSRWDYSCDVDFFMLNVGEYVKNHLTVRFCDILTKNKYVICKSSASVLTAIGYWGKRRIQLIWSTAKTADQLIHNFDLNVAKSYYDGKDLYFTSSAYCGWLDKKCYNGSLTPIKPERLARIHLKGFELLDDAKKQVKCTLGFPLSEEITNKLLYDIPCLTPNIPPKVQEAMLKRLKLPIVKNIKKFIKEDNKLVMLGNSYGPVGIYSLDDMEEFVNSVEINKKHIKSINDWIKSKPNIRLILTPIKSKFLVKLPVCYLPWTYNPFSSCKLNKITIPKENTKDAENFYDWNTKIIRSILGSSYSCDYEKYRYYDISVKLDNKSSWYLNGIKYDKKFVIKENTTIQVVASPVMIIANSSYDIIIQYLVNKLYINVPYLEYEEINNKLKKVKEDSEEEGDSEEEDILDINKYFK